MVTVYEVTSRKDFKEFFKYPLRLYKNNPYYTPILLQEEMDTFNPKKNGAYEFCESKLFLAKNEKGETVGRIAAIFNKAYNEKTGKKQMRFSRIDAINDSEVFEALIAAVKAYALEKGMNEIVGPLGFCDTDQEGLLVEGFEEDDIYITIYNAPYYMKQLERLGFTKRVDWLEYRITVPEQIDPRLPKLVESIEKKYGYRYLVIDKKDIPALFSDALQIMNQAYAHLYGYVPLNQRMIENCIDQFAQIVRTDYVTVIVDKEGKMVAYAFFAPSLSKVMKKAWGKLGLFDIIRFVKNMQGNEVVDLLSVGVLPSHANTGVGAMVLYNALQAMIRTGVRYAETGPELETNSNIQNLWKNYEKRQHRRRRCYGLDLTQE